MSDAATLLFAAIHTNNLEGVKLLVQAEPELLTAVSPSGLSPVLFAAYYHRPDILRHLIEAGAPLNIFEAAAAGEGERVRELLDENPLLVNAVSPDGFTPLGLAAFFGREEVASELLAQGADVNAVSENAMQVQPLHSAVAGNHAQLAEALVEAGANVNATQHGGFTPLMGAAQNGNAALVAFLLERGANMAARTEDGRDAYALAAEENHESVLKLLPSKTDHPEESQNANVRALGQTEHMNENDKEVIGQTGAVTGFDTPDPKEGDPDTIYTSTPARDRVGVSDHSTYQAVEIPDAKSVTGQFDQLATRNIDAMENALQEPEFAGSDSVAPLEGMDMVDLVNQQIRSEVDQNPNYTPPSQMTPPHLSPRAAGLPEGDGAQLEEEVRTNIPEK